MKQKQKQKASHFGFVPAISLTSSSRVLHLLQVTIQRISKTIFRTIKDRNMELLYLSLFKVSSLVGTLCCESMSGLLKLFVLKFVITSL